MFLSLPQYEFQAPAGLGQPGLRHWRVVEAPLHAPWYLLTVGLGEPSDASAAASYTLCIAWDTDLADAIRSVEPNRICGLVVMLPARTSPTGQWASRQIGEVWLDTNEAGNFVTLLDVAGEQIETDSLIEPPKASVKGELLLRLSDERRSRRSEMPGPARVRSSASHAQ